MGSVHTASCQCGFTTDVTVGGGRMTFHQDSKFPFYCQSCGLVAVNVAPLARDCTETTCPQCNAEGAVQYGVPPVSLHDMRRSPGKLVSQFWEKQKPQEKHWAALQWGSREASESGHLCPACHQITLKFSIMASVMYD